MASALRLKPPHVPPVPKPRLVPTRNVLATAAFIVLASTTAEACVSPEPTFTSTGGDCGSGKEPPDGYPSPSTSGAQLLST